MISVTRCGSTTPLRVWPKGHNFFQPVLRQCERKVIPTKSGIYRIRRKQDVARTPLERLLEKENLDPGAVQGLLDLYQWTNPRTLRDTIYTGRYHGVGAQQRGGWLSPR